MNADRDSHTMIRVPSMMRGLSRRSALAALIMATAGTRAGALLEAADRKKGKTEAARGEAEEVARIQEEARKAGLGRFGLSRTEHFLALGDAPDTFRLEAVELCEELGTALFAYFRNRGITLAYPAGRLTILILKDVKSYTALLGEAPGAEVGGHYDIDTNRLVIFDFRPQRGELAAKAEVVNLFTLVHETAHQLSFNTGLLPRNGDVPLCLSEGLATFVELWRRGARNAIGSVNRPRLLALRQAARTENAWISIADLLDNDDAFRDESIQQLAYAESWLLMHYLVKTPSRLPRLKAYLAALKKAGRPDPTGRVHVAEANLGSLAALDREVKAHARQVLRD